MRSLLLLLAAPSVLSSNTTATGKLEFGEGWRVDLGIALLTILVLTWVLSMTLIIVIGRARKAPFRSSFWLLYASMASCNIVSIGKPIMEIYGEDACLYAETAGRLAGVFYLAPLFTATYRYFFLFRTEGHKQEMAAANVEPAVIENFKKMKMRHSNGVIGAVNAIAVSVPLAFVFFDSVLNPIDCTRANDNASGRWTATALATLSTLMILAIVLPGIWLFYTYKATRRQVIYLWLQLLVPIIAIIVSAAIPKESNLDATHSWTFATVLWHIGAVYLPVLFAWRKGLYKGMFKSGFSTYAGGTHGDVLPRAQFEMLIRTDLGFHEFFEFLKSVFATENLLFYRAVDTYRAAPDSRKLGIIYERFVVPGIAPLEVNLPAATKNYLSLKVPELLETEECPTDVFDDAQKIIAKLMYQNIASAFAFSQELLKAVLPASRSSRGRSAVSEDSNARFVSASSPKTKTRDTSTSLAEFDGLELTLVKEHHSPDL